MESVQPVQMNTYQSVTYRKDFSWLHFDNYPGRWLLKKETPGNDQYSNFHIKCQISWDLLWAGFCLALPVYLQLASYLVLFISCILLVNLTSPGKCYQVETTIFWSNSCITRYIKIWSLNSCPLLFTGIFQNNNIIKIIKIIKQEMNELVPCSL